MDKASVHFLTFSKRSINYVSQLFSENGYIKKWHEFKREYSLEKLTSTELYSILISQVQNKPSTNIYFKNLFNDYNIDSTAIYIYHTLLQNLKQCPIC